MVVRSSAVASSASLYPTTERASGVAMKRVPTHTPSAPSARAAASPRPSKMPPAATTGTVAPTASTIWGTRGNVATKPVCPPASVPWATTTSQPASTACPAWIDLAAHVDDEKPVAVAQLHHLDRYPEPGHEHRCAPFDDPLDERGHLAGHGSQEVDAEGLVGEPAHEGNLPDSWCRGTWSTPPDTRTRPPQTPPRRGGDRRRPPMPASMTGCSISSSSVRRVCMRASSAAGTCRGDRPTGMSPPDWALNLREPVLVATPARRRLVLSHHDRCPIGPAPLGGPGAAHASRGDRPRAPDGGAGGGQLGPAVLGAAPPTATALSGPELHSGGTGRRPPRGHGAGDSPSRTRASRCVFWPPTSCGCRGSRAPSPCPTGSWTNCPGRRRRWRPVPLPTTPRRRRSRHGLVDQRARRHRGARRSGVVRPARRHSASARLTRRCGARRHGSCAMRCARRSPSAGLGEQAGGVDLRGGHVPTCGIETPGVRGARGRPLCTWAFRWSTRRIADGDVVVFYENTHRGTFRFGDAHGDGMRAAGTLRRSSQAGCCATTSSWASPPR